MGNMIYSKYIDLPNWESLRDQIVSFWKKQQSKNELWWCYFPDEVEKEIPDLKSAFSTLGLTMRQMIIFNNPPNDLNVNDPLDTKAVFIHTDREDDPEARYENSKPVLTNFKTSNAINIPLINCEKSFTLFYKQLNDNSDVYYKTMDCGGHAKQDVEEVFRFELNKPAVLRINVPHAVYNPHNEDRIVATFRFNESLEDLFND